MILVSWDMFCFVCIWLERAEQRRGDMGLIGYQECYLELEMRIALRCSCRRWQAAMLGPNALPSQPLFSLVHSLVLPLVVSSSICFPSSLLRSTYSINLCEPS